MNLQADLWTKLKETKKPILLYGMGNGADKILAVLESRGITAADFFASDGFVRGHSFHEKRVLTFAEAKEKYGDFVILLSFGSALPEVLRNFYRMDEQMEFYAPDVPIAGEELFDAEFCRVHARELAAARALFADEFSRTVFDRVVKYRLTGSIRPLREFFTPEERIWQEVLRPARYRSCADLGAYTGDSIRTLLEYAPGVSRIEAFEPDPRSYRKLCGYLETSGLTFVHAHHAGAWNADTTEIFSSQGNRNSSVYGVKRGTQIPMRCLDSVMMGQRLDYLKIDVEGAEREALEGAAKTIRQWMPDIRLSLYHRSRDLFALPLFLHALCPEYRFYLRRPEYVPAWDLCLYALAGGR